MSEHGPRTGAARDVPPPRPVTAAAEPEPVDDGSPLGRAARAVADAVAGLVGGSGGRTTTTPDASEGRRSPAAGLGDVVGAVVGALGAAWGRRDGDGARDGGSARGPDAPVGDRRTPAALLGDLLNAAAPRLPIPDRGALRQAFPGATEDEIADALVARAARLTAAIGAATGGIAAAHWLATPSLLALPLELGAETVLIGAVEVVLLGELHELTGRPAPGDARARAAAYLTSWSEQHAVEGPGRGGLVTAVTSVGIRSLSRRMGRRLTRGLPVAAPFLVGAALAGRSNRRATENLGQRVLGDLRIHRGGRG